MSIQVTHPDTLTPTNKLNDIIYAHQHTVNSDIDSSDMSTAMQTLITNIETLLTALSGKTIKIKVLIETKTITTGVSSVTFSDLDGDTDEQYYIEYKLIPTTSGTYLVLSPNGLSTNQNGTSWSFGTVGSGGVGNTSVINIGYGHTNIVQISGHGIFNSKSGVIREAFFNMHDITSSTFQRYFWEGLWRDTTTNLTSLVISISSGTITGEISLYKIIKISL